MCLGQNLRSRPVGQGIGRQYIDGHAEQLAQIPADGAKIEERGFARWIDQDVEVTVLGIGAMQDRSEDARVPNSIATDHPANFCPMALKEQRRLQGRVGWGLTGYTVYACDFNIAQSKKLMLRGNMRISRTLRPGGVGPFLACATTPCKRG